MQVGRIGRLQPFVYRRYLVNIVHFRSTKVSSNVVSTFSLFIYPLSVGDFPLATSALFQESFRNYDAYWPKSFINRMLNSDLLVEVYILSTYYLSVTFVYFKCRPV